MGRKFLKKRIEPIDPLKTRRVDEFVTALAGCSFQGRSMAYALDVWEAMCRDEDCLRVLSLAGAMVPAGMGLVVTRLIEKKLVDAIICTGATVSHDLCNIVDKHSQAHFVGDEFADDEALREESINRIYDTYLPEKGFHKAESVMATLYRSIEYDEEGDHTRLVSTSSFLRQMGHLLKGPGILTAAARAEIPIFVPAVSDSEMGLNVELANSHGDFGPGKRMEFSTLEDVKIFGRMIASHKRAGLVSIGGGVPRNWAQQVYPFMNMKLHDTSMLADGYHYGVRITTDRPEFGGLSGCTISESKSWGKYANRAVEASVVCDATIALPLLSAALMQRMGKQGAR